MQRYINYKDSNIGWLGKIPNHWEKNKFKFLLREKPTTQNIDLPCGSISFGKVIYKNFEKLTEETKFAYQEVLSGEFVINPLNLNYDLRSLRTALSEIDVIVSSGYIVLQSENVVESNYLKWLLFIFDIRHMKTLGAGIRQTITFKDIGNCTTFIPSRDEQQTIANFLDRETARIEKLITEKQKFIKLLKEKREALISHVVTKGLDPNVKMKDSGIEWIGEVPEHWELTKLRYLGQCQNGINIGGEYFGNGYPFVSYSDVYKNRILPSEIKGLVQSSESDQKYYSVKEGDIFFTRTSETIEEIGFASVCKSTVDNAVFAGFLIRLRPALGKILLDYSEYYFQNEKLRVFFVKEMNLVTRASLSQELLKQMPVLIPPKEEQQKITEHLKLNIGRIESLISETERSILLLKEYRIALISSAVTGKIDVRSETTNSFDKSAI